MDGVDVQIFVVVSSLALFLLVTLLISLFLFFQKKKIQFVLDRQHRAAKYKEELLQAQIDTNEQSLQTIGRELHDNIGQLLSISKMKLGMILRTNNKENRTDLVETHEIIAKSLYELRQLSKSLNNNYVEQIGFIPAIKAEAERVNRLNLCATNLMVEGLPVNIRAEDALSLYRIIQECISNCLKHAGATTLTISLKYSQKNLYLHIEDNGVGFDPIEAPKGTGFMNMESRVQLLSATWKIKSDQKEGTKISITYPIRHYEKTNL